MQIIANDTLKFDDIEIRNFLKNIYKYTNDITLKEHILRIFKIRKNMHIKHMSFKLKKIQELINDFICNINFQNLFNEPYDPDVIKIFNTLTKFKKYKNKFDKFKKGPIVNFEIYEHYENLHLKTEYNSAIPSTLKINTDFFYTNVLNIILRDIVFDDVSMSYPTNLKVNDIKNSYNGTKIFAHGSLIRQIWKKFNSETYELSSHLLENMMNTSIINDKISIYEQNHIICDHTFSIDEYVPEKIRENDILNFEYYNENICDVNSVKGIINNIPLINNNDDAKFYNENIEKFNSNSIPSQFAGEHNLYKNKYLKYKNKYLYLKNKMF